MFVLLEVIISDCRSLCRSKAYAYQPMHTTKQPKSLSRTRTNVWKRIKRLLPIKAKLVAQLSVHQSPHAKGTTAQARTYPFYQVQPGM
jgi:hypothetical protein